jgi:hypothetical protein
MLNFAVHLVNENFNTATPLKKVAKEVLQKPKGGVWTYSNLFSVLSALANWNGPRPSEVGLCHESMDIVFIHQWWVTHSLYESTSRDLHSLLNTKAKRYG